MVNEEKPTTELPQFAQTLLQDHNACLNELSVLSATFSKEEQENLPISWHGKQIGIGLHASAKLSQIPYSIDDTLPSQEVFQ